MSRNLEASSSYEILSHLSLDWQVLGKGSYSAQVGVNKVWSKSEVDDKVLQHQEKQDFCSFAKITKTIFTTWTVSLLVSLLEVKS